MVFDVRTWLAEQLRCGAEELELAAVAKRGDGEEHASYLRAGRRASEVVISGTPATLGGNERRTVTAFLSSGRRAFADIAPEADVSW